jgi:predicted metalloprotease with PDZ domain
LPSSSVYKRHDLLLREKYENGEISADDFLKKLFNSREGNRKVGKVLENNKEALKKLQQA